MNTLQPFIKIMADNCRWVLLDVKRARTVWWNSGLPTDEERRYVGDSGILMPCANAMILQTEVADKLLAMYPDWPIAGYYFDIADGRRYWGLRARNGTDCLAIAREYGGGGHKQESWFIQIP